jgi:hypothetical protein
VAVGGAVGVSVGSAVATAVAVDVAVATAVTVANGVVSTSGSGWGWGGGSVCAPHAARSAGEIMAALITERTTSLMGERPWYIPKAYRRNLTR